MVVLNPVYSFTPRTLREDAKPLNNAQIAQAMVRGQEVISHPSTIDSLLLTLGGVRMLRTYVKSALDSGEVCTDDKLIEAIIKFIGISDEDLIDIQFE